MPKTTDCTNLKQQGISECLTWRQTWTVPRMGTFTTINTHVRQDATPAPTTSPTPRLACKNTSLQGTQCSPSSKTEFPWLQPAIIMKRKPAVRSTQTLSSRTAMHTALPTCHANGPGNRQSSHTLIQKPATPSQHRHTLSPHLAVA